MIPFDINFMLAVLKYNLKQLYPRSEFDLTIKPTKADFFEEVPTSERENYLKYVSACYYINIQNKIFYLFIRNGRDTSTNRYTRLSSIELGYVTSNNTFKSISKRHFEDMFDLISSDEEEMTCKANVVVSHILADIKKEVI